MIINTTKADKTLKLKDLKSGECFKIVSGANPLICEELTSLYFIKLKERVVSCDGDFNITIGSDVPIVDLASGKVCLMLETAVVKILEAKVEVKL